MRFYDAKKGLDEVREVNFTLRLDEAQKSADWSEASENMHFTAVAEPNFKLSYAPLPGFVAGAKNFKELTKNFKEFIYRNYKLRLFSALNLSSAPGESKEEFYVRLADKCNEILEAQTAKLTAEFDKQKARLEEKLNRSVAKLEKEQRDFKSKGIETAISVGASILGAIFGKGLLSSGNIGKVATSARSANSVLKERSDVKLSEQEVAQLNAQIEELMAKFEEDASALKAKNDVQNVEVTDVEVSPKSSDIYDEKLYLLWK